MEELIPLLILVITGIISLLASPKKSRRSNKEPSSSFQSNTREGHPAGPSQATWQQESEASPAGKNMESPLGGEEESPLREEFTGQTGTSERREFSGEPEASEPEKFSEQPETPKKEERIRTVEEEKRKKEEKDRRLSKQAVKKTGKKPKPKSRLEVIRERFDVEEAVLYSEIINRKYF